MSGRVLIVDDDPDTRTLLSAALTEQGLEVLDASDASSALVQLETQPFSLVLTDVHIAGMSGIELCTQIRDGHPATPVIVMTGQAKMQTAVEALRAGAHDFLTKPVDVPHLLHRVDGALRYAELETEIRRLHRVLDRSEPTPMIGESPSLRRVQSLIARVADSDVPVLVTGESGVGKELVARELHRLSANAEGPFVALNCAAVPIQLLESQLFGHVRGAFTDARRARDGLFVRANGGSLFLDEIGELPLEVQPKLLRAVQERKVRPVGSDKLVSFDARIITATNLDLEAEVEEQRFREDLFYRINVVNIHVPPLRARRTDILLLAQHFLDRISARHGKPVKRIAANVAEKLLPYDWPGNVRELENCMERAVALARYDEITVADLPDKLRHCVGGELVIAAEDLDELPTLAALEERYIRRVLRAVKGNKTQAAQILGLARRTLYRRLERLEDQDQDQDPTEDDSL
ncbi:Transcriptional regulatory protein ZraR [Enhygromyxa salina]|uniref:Transcriptional regulatory protein ZraR n=1 Tax=Enhygromyxa salina TaxID=215803 RepID=A0A2S9YHE3_9BACT|nr:sigma-54 dependent transcriptional regulator [Enhygromyxa salina]PRQ04426.1 Transcriptional regulatory protein ZraR [Enhygromyxa salina]